MSFWLGVFAGLAVWKGIMTLAALGFYGKTVTYGTRELLLEAGQLVVFAMVAWYLATFGGAA